MIISVDWSLQHFSAHRLLRRRGGDHEEREGQAYYLRDRLRQRNAHGGGRVRRAMEGIARKVVLYSPSHGRKSKQKR